VAWEPLEEPAAQFVLEAGDPAGQSRLGDAELAARGGEGAGGDDRPHGHEILEVHGSKHIVKAWKA